MRSSKILLLLAIGLIPAAAGASVVKTYVFNLNPHAVGYDGETFSRHFKVTLTLVADAHATAEASALADQSCQYQSNGDIELPYACVPGCRSTVRFGAVTAQMFVQDLDHGRALTSDPVTMTLVGTDLTVGDCSDTVPQISSKKTDPTYRLTELSVVFGATKESEVLAMDVNELTAEFHRVGQNSYQVDTLNVPDKFNGTVRFTQNINWAISSQINDGKVMEPAKF